MIVRAENYYPSSEDECGSQTKFWECDHVYFRIYHFDSEDEFEKAAKALQADLETLSRPLPGDETPFNAVEAEFHFHQRSPHRCIIRGAIIYVMNDAGKTIEVIRTDSRAKAGSLHNGLQQTKYPGRKRRIIVPGPTEREDLSQKRRGQVPVTGRQKADQKDPYVIVHDELGDRLPDDSSRSLLDRSYYTAVVVGPIQKGSTQRGPGPLYLSKSSLEDECAHLYPGQYLSILGGAPHRHVDWRRIRSWENLGVIKPVKLASTSMLGFSKKSI